MPIFAARDVLVGDNDFSAIITVRGLDPLDASEELYHGTQVKAFWAATSDSNTALGSVTVDCPEIGAKGEFSVNMDATQVVTALSGLAEGTPVFLIGRAQNDWRRFKEFTVRKAGAFL